jgi:hypothetical protein
MARVVLSYLATPHTTFRHGVVVVCDNLSVIKVLTPSFMTSCASVRRLRFAVGFIVSYRREKRKNHAVGNLNQRRPQSSSSSHDGFGGRCQRDDERQWCHYHWSHCQWNWYPGRAGSFSNHWPELLQQRVTW